MKRFFKDRSTSSDTAGFALIATISILVLLALIAVGLLSLSTTVIRSSSREGNAAVARANARMALMMAIGQLQKHAGDDRRVTMTADQINGSSDGSGTGASTERKHWTGVYRGWDHTVVQRPTPEFLAWLVSSPGPEKLREDAPESAGNGNGSIELVGSGTVGSGPEGRVTVPVVRLADGSALAWWTGDQGVKAMLALPQPDEPEDLAGVRARMQAAPTNEVAMASVGAEQPFMGMDASDPRLGVLGDWTQADFFASEPKAQQGLFHDLAAASSGLLVNVREGGFRKDLSMYLETRSEQMPREPLYTVAREPGINFEEIGIYYNLYKELRSGRGNFTTGGSLPSGVPLLSLSRNADECKKDYEHHFKQPVIISYQMAFSLQANMRTDNRGRQVQSLYLVADPIITFWNPLDVPVIIPKTAFLSVKYWQLPYDLMIRIGGRAPIRCPLVSSLSGATRSSNSDYNYLSIRAGEIEQLTFRPGEVIKVSQSGDTIVKGTNRADHSLQGRSGFNYGGGVSLPVRDVNGGYIDLRGDSEIAYELIPNNLTCGSSNRSGNSLTGRKHHSRHFSLNHHEYYVGTDRKTNSLGIGGMLIDDDFGNSRILAGDTPRQLGTPGTKPAGERLYADGFPEVFKTIAGSDTRTFTPGELFGRKAPIMLVSYNAKTENGSDLGTKSLARFNPRAFYVDFYDLSEEERDRLPYEFTIEPLLSWKNRRLETSSTGNAYFGGGLDASTGTSYVVTHSVPQEPLVSLAALQHSCANGFGFQKPVYGYAALNGREPMQPQISHAIGNSMAPSVLDPDQTEKVISGGRPLADHSYLANEALWDDWFFSSIAPRTARSFDERKGQKEVATEFFEGTGSIANSRYRPALGGREASEVLGRLFAGSRLSAEAPTLVAPFLRVDGMFNVNSTSVEAWKVMLSGLNKRAVVTRDEGGQVQLTENSAGIPVAGLINPLEEVADGSKAMLVTDRSQWSGRRVLSEDEVDELARAIVREVRKRGPFLSLADFVNRRVGTDEELARAGAVQSALDAEDVSINDGYDAVDREVLSAVADRLAFPEAEKGPISQGIPGIVKQADVLTPIAPVLSVRSDSFVIRAYGEATNAAGEVLARAYCEAVVEREAEYLTREEDLETLPEDLRNEVDKEFGRKIRVRSFRWLTPEEV